MKKIVALSTVAFLATSAFANADLEKRLADLEKKNEYLMKRVSDINAHTAGDNVKFDVDFRTSYDYIQYKDANGKKYGNDALYSNRLWLNMGYAPTKDMIFKGQLSYQKAFGAAPMGDTATGMPQRGMGFDTFDWIANQTLNDDKVRVREAYWLWMPKVGDYGFTVSVGRRPSTNGFLANIREDDASPKSPSGHVINMEFDGASAGIKLDKVLPGMLFKICLGRGLTNASGWGENPAGNYIKDSSRLKTIDMAGFIFVPYDDGQYSVQTTWYRGFNVPGMDRTHDFENMGAMMNGMPAPHPEPAMPLANAGDMDGMAISALAKGIGDGISDFLDETTIFASYAMSKTHPDAKFTRNGTVGMMDGTPIGMFGEQESKTGHSIWAGVTMPNMTGGKFGLEYNKGSKYWKAFTFGEDTMIGSKLNARGDAYEAHWTQPLIGKAFSMQVRYTYIDYKYTGSNGFFADGGTPMTIAQAKNMGMGSQVVDTAQDLRVYFRYRY